MNPNEMNLAIVRCLECFYALILLYGHHTYLSGLLSIDIDMAYTLLYHGNR